MELCRIGWARSILVAISGLALGACESIVGECIQSQDMTYQQAYCCHVVNNASGNYCQSTCYRTVSGQQCTLYRCRDGRQSSSMMGCMNLTSNSTPSPILCEDVTSGYAL
jgi:hypothetical protein